MDSNSPIRLEAQKALRSEILRALDAAECGTINQADAILAIMNKRESKLEALSEARNVEMEQALGRARDNSILMLEWKRRYESEALICERAFTARDEALAALRKASSI